MRRARDAGLAVLGFKPMAAIGPELTAGPARFVHPDERGGRGSTAAFVALHKALLDQVRARARACLCWAAIGQCVG